MATPRYTEQQLWQKLNRFIGSQVWSLTGKCSHRLVSTDQAKRQYTIEYASGNTKQVKFDELYALYTELYLLGELSNAYMEQHRKRILGWPQWHAPGSAMMALLPVLDENLTNRGGTLVLKDRG